MVFEGGDYERLYIAPNHRLGHSILASREVLVLATGFHKLQTRVIRFAEECLASASVRLERNMVIVVHVDPEGDRKLRSWGAERGLTVLPVHSNPRVPQGDALEAALCAGLYSNDPFDLAGPVSNVHQFFGRSDVPDQARRLRDGHIQALFGTRKIGKTSVLNRIVKEAREFHGMAAVFVDCEDDSLSEMSAGGLLNSIAGALNEAVEDDSDPYRSTTPLSGDYKPADSGRVLLHIIRNSSAPILLVIDEVDYITPSSPTAAHWATEFNPFFRALRTVYQETCRLDSKFSVVVSGVSSRWFAVDSIGGVENAALAFVPEGYLPPFERPQSREMLQTLGRAAGLIFRGDVADHIAYVCSDFPFWLRRAGSFFHSCYRQKDRPLEVDIEDARQLCAEFAEVEGAGLAYSSLVHLFNIYPELGEAATALTKRSKPPSSVLVSALGRYGLIDAEGDPSGPIVKAGLEHWLKTATETPLPFPRETLSGSDLVVPGSISEAGEAEWSELLSEVSGLRNALERDLRDFIQLVVRMRCADRNDGRTPADVVLTGLSSDRRAAFAGKSIQATLKGTYWPELIGIIKKNWPMFLDYFGDRKQLELQADIVNDRPDSHAKDFDGADLALQRRAIAWINERIAASGLL
jgi:hypothetical protein